MRSLSLLFVASLLLAAPVSHANSSSVSLDVGAAVDYGLGLTAKYGRYSLFVGGDGAAFDVRMKNFSRNNHSYYFYIDLGAFIEDHDGRNVDKDDRIGLRVPFGIHFGIEKDIYAYAQLAPAIDFNNDTDFDVEAALGVRFRF
jgi:hypothetical protein